ncbi:hypothetical protein [Mangrovibacterium lignilyticum]|uniref:hypothetical protein n=1 Tax=Mangrovibacterium lignilyticum TaxID=2668052 RepID=UPI0013D4FE65|nr:hypothetical protein [Mangrovibacterium lignilyticum]
MELIMYISAAVLYSVFAAYTSAYFAATQYWGLKLTYTKSTIDNLVANAKINHYMSTINVNGLQSAITTKRQKYKSYFRFSLNFPLFIVGASLFEWYVPIIALIGVLFLKNTLRQFLPPANSTTYLKKIIHDLEDQSHQFENKLRMEDKAASDFFIQQLRINHSA